jgi:hypothetical protein
LVGDLESLEDWFGQIEIDFRSKIHMSHNIRSFTETQFDKGNQPIRTNSKLFSSRTRRVAHVVRKAFTNSRDASRHKARSTTPFRMAGKNTKVAVIQSTLFELEE